MSLARPFNSFFKTAWGSEASFWLAVVVAPLLLPLEADVCFGNQVGSSLIESTLGLLILALRSFAIALFILGGFILFRVSVIGFVRLDILDDRIHELSHLTDRPLESAEFLY